MWMVFFLFNLLKLQRSPVAYAVIILVCVLIYLRVDFNRNDAKEMVAVALQVARLSDYCDDLLLFNIKV